MLPVHYEISKLTIIYFRTKKRLKPAEIKSTHLSRHRSVLYIRELQSKRKKV